MSAQIYDFEIEKAKREGDFSISLKDIEEAWSPGECYSPEINKILMDIGVMDTSDIKVKEDEN